MLHNDLLLRALRCEPTERPPIWLLRQAGRYQASYRALRTQEPDFFAFCKNPSLTTQAALYPVEPYQTDAAILFSDILTIPEALGMPIQFVKNQGPIFSEPIKNKQDIDALCQKKTLPNLDYVGHAVADLKSALQQRVPLIGFSGSPWTLAAYMIQGHGSKDFMTARAFSLSNEDATHQLLNHLSQEIIAYLDMQIRLGADAIMLFDTWGGLWALPEYKRFSLFYMRKIINTLKQQHDTPIIVFTKGGGMWLDNIQSCGCSGISLDWQTPLEKALSQIKPHIAIQGNIDPLLLFHPNKLQIEIKSILQQFGSHPGLIINLGHGIQPTTPEANVHLLVKMVKNFTSDAFTANMK